MSSYLCTCISFIIVNIITDRKADNPVSQSTSLSHSVNHQKKKHRLSFFTASASMFVCLNPVTFDLTKQPTAYTKNLFPPTCQHTHTHKQCHLPLALPSLHTITRWALLTDNVQLSLSSVRERTFFSGSFVIRAVE